MPERLPDAGAGSHSGIMLVTYIITTDKVANTKIKIERFQVWISERSMYKKSIDEKR